MNNSKDKNSYETRWLEARKSNDTSILRFEEADTFPSFFYLEYNKLTLTLLEDKLGRLSSETKILEVGCGRATASIYLGVKRGCKLKPIDYSKNAIDIANINLRNNGLEENAEVGDIFEYETSEKFDAVISYGVMEHMPDIKSAYKSMLAKMKPGGVMISMNVPEKRRNIQTIFAPINRTLFKVNQWLAIKDNKPWLDKTNRGQTGNVYRTYNSSKEFAQKCEEAGFVNVKVIEVNPFPTINPLPYRAERFLVRLFRIILNIKFKLKKNEYVFQTSEFLSRCHFVIAECPR